MVPERNDGSGIEILRGKNETEKGDLEIGVYVETNEKKNVVDDFARAKIIFSRVT